MANPMRPRPVRPARPAPEPAQSRPPDLVGFRRNAAAGSQVASAASRSVARTVVAEPAAPSGSGEPDPELNVPTDEFRRAAEPERSRAIATPPAPRLPYGAGKIAACTWQNVSLQRSSSNPGFPDVASLVWIWSGIWPGSLGPWMRASRITVCPLASLRPAHGNSGWKHPDVSPSARWPGKPPTPSFPPRALLRTGPR